MSRRERGRERVEKGDSTLKVGKIHEGERKEREIDGKGGRK